jgi:Peptidase family M23
VRIERNGIPGSVRYLRTVVGMTSLVVMLALTSCSTEATPTSTNSSTAAAATTQGPDEVTPLVGSVPFAPIPFVGSDDKNHLVYELSVTNFTGAPMIVDRVQVNDGSDRVVGDLDAAAVRGRLQPAGSRDGTDRLVAGQSGTIFIHLTIDAGAAVPDTLVHEVTVTADAMPPGQNNPTIRLAATKVDQRQLPVLSAPLAGERYIAADGCCDAVRHTRAILPINGQTFVAQRYAIDYEQADDQNRIFTGDPRDPRNYAIFGKEVLAVADGTVVGTRNDLPEQVPGTFPAGIAIDEADGNYVVLDIGNGFYVNYAHMQPGSVQPKVGDRVAKGAVLGLVGNTGNSVAPHLHLHVMNGPSPLASQGLPALYERFTVTGQVASTADFDAAEGEGVPLVLMPGRTSSDHTDQMILDQNIVTFTG